MYNEINIIKLIPNKDLRILLYMDFVEEYSGWLQHLRNTGGTWGASAELVGAAKEAVKVKEHIKLLKDNILLETETGNGTCKSSIKRITKETRQLSLF